MSMKHLKTMKETMHNNYYRSVSVSVIFSFSRLYSPFLLLIFCSQVLRAKGSSVESSIRFLQLADWGGQGSSPFYTPGQKEAAEQMSQTADDISADFVLALGDNFYENGISGDSHSPRFSTTWKSIYSSKSLSVNWYLCAGNHDYRGNVSAQIEYSKLSTNWVFPTYYYKKSFQSPDKSVTLDLIMIDTQKYTGVYRGGTYPKNFNDKLQHKFIEYSLRTSKANYIIVGGHYPVYSACDHGSTITLINHLKPLLEKYGAHYFSGHDHCVQHIEVNNVNYWLNGIGHDCCYSDMQRKFLPEGSLKYILAKKWYDIWTLFGTSDVNGSKGGFSSVVATAEKMTVTFVDQRGIQLYSSVVLPRSLELLESNSNITKSSTKLNNEHKISKSKRRNDLNMIGSTSIIVLGAISAIVVLIAGSLCIYLLLFKYSAKANRQQYEPITTEQIDSERD